MYRLAIAAGLTVVLSNSGMADSKYDRRTLQKWSQPKRLGYILGYISLAEVVCRGAVPDEDSSKIRASVELVRALAASSFSRSDLADGKQIGSRDAGREIQQYGALPYCSNLIKRTSAPMEAW
jgi:GrpB-like predicted nucleotidyltransferase (UPF0157 family)